MNHVSKLAIAAALALGLASNAMAGGLGAAVVEGEPIAVTEVGGAGGLGVVPLALLGLVAIAAIAGGGGDDDDDNGGGEEEPPPEEGPEEE